MKSVTVMERDDIRVVVEREFNAFVDQLPQDSQNWWVRTTSGTTQKAPLVIAARVDDTDQWGSGGGARLLCSGLRSVRLHNVMLARKAQGADMRVCVVDNSDLAQPFAALIEDVSPSRIAGFPSFIARVALSLSPQIKSAVVSLRCTGEVIGSALSDLFSAQFPNASIQMLYKANEIGMISKPTCGKGSGNAYHPRSDVTVDIEKPDEHGVGSLLISVSTRGIVRYRIGDLVRFIDGACACGEAVTFQIVGRAGFDYVKVVGALIHRAEFDRVTLKFKDILDYRAEVRTTVRQGALRGAVVLTIYAPEWDEAARAAFERDFAKECFVTASSTIADLVEGEVFEPFQVVLSQVPFEPTHKDIKIFQHLS